MFLLDFYQFLRSRVCLWVVIASPFSKSCFAVYGRTRNSFSTFGKMDSKSRSITSLQGPHNLSHNSPLYTLILPFRINPYTDGRSWARREGYDQHHGVRLGEELTDEEDDADDY
jgi:hypothetical protein